MKNLLAFTFLFTTLYGISCTPIASNIEKTPIKLPKKDAPLESPAAGNNETQNTEIDGKVYSKNEDQSNPSLTSRIFNKSINKGKEPEETTVESKPENSFKELFKYVEFNAELIASKNWETKVKTIQSEFLKANAQKDTLKGNAEFFILTDSQIEGLQKNGNFLFQIEAEKLPKKIWLTLALKPNNAATSVRELEKKLLWSLEAESLSIWQIGVKSKFSPDKIKQNVEENTELEKPPAKALVEELDSSNRSQKAKDERKKLFENTQIVSGFLKITYRQDPTPSSKAENTAADGLEKANETPAKKGLIPSVIPSSSKPDMD